jgi:hypothetical protein
MSEPQGFEWRATRDGKVFVSHEGRVVTTLAGDDAKRFLARVADADTSAAQHLMARVTGNFKRGTKPGGRG